MTDEERKISKERGVLVGRLFGGPALSPEEERRLEWLTQELSRLEEIRMEPDLKRLEAEAKAMKELADEVTQLVKDVKGDAGA